MRVRVATGSLVLLCLLTGGAAPDNNVEWNGISHVAWQDRRPLCPVDGQSFGVLVQAYHLDLTGVRVHYNDGTAGIAEGYFVANRGIYDVWRADVPATAATTLTYYIEVADGNDTDYLSPSGMTDGVPGDTWTLNFTDLSHAPLGATRLSDGGCVFRVWAPTAASAKVAGTFNSWNSSNLPLSRSGAYVWRRVNNVPANAQYKYVFGSNTWKPDARSRAHNASDNYNSYVIDPFAYAWQDGAFRTPSWEEMVIYELHVGTFSGKGDGLNRLGRYRDIVDRHLDHLLSLGVNAVELIPISEAYSQFTSWGYNPVSPYAPEYDYGSAHDLKYTIDKLHQAGIAVILDIVPNHFSPSDNFLWYYDGQQVYFDDPAVQTPWGSQAAFWKSEVQDYFSDNVLYWLEEYHVDGFRMDATRYMRDNFIFPDGYPHGWGLMQRINEAIDRRKADAFSIAEELPNDPAITNAVAAGGAGFDAQWHDAFNDDVRQELFDAAFGDPEIWRVRDAVDAGGYSPKTKLIRYIESHDEAGNFERLTVAIDSANPYGFWARSRGKLAQGLALLAPGVPMFLMGGEWFEEAKFGSSSSERIDWAKAAARQPSVQFFRDAIGVRRSNCGLRSDAPVNLYGVTSQLEADNLLVFTRGAAQELVVIANFGNNNYTNYALGLPRGGTWYELLNSQAADYDGNGWGNGGAVVASGPGNTAYLTIPQAGLLVLRFDDPPGRASDLDGDGDTDLIDYGLLQAAAGWSGCGLAYDVRENGRVDANDAAVLGTALAGPQ